MSVKLGNVLRAQKSRVVKSIFECKREAVTVVRENYIMKTLNDCIVQ